MTEGSEYFGTCEKCGDRAHEGDIECPRYSRPRPEKPEKRYENRTTQQVPFRLQFGPHREFKEMVAVDGLSMQMFLEACVTAYVNGDRHIRDVARAHKKVVDVDRKKFKFSEAERQRLMEEIEGD